MSDTTETPDETTPDETTTEQAEARQHAIALAKYCRDLGASSLTIPLEIESEGSEGPSTVSCVVKVYYDAVMPEE